MLAKFRVEFLLLISEHPGVIRFRLIGDENGRPILVCEPKPAAIAGYHFFLSIWLQSICVGHLFEPGGSEYTD